MKSRKSSCKVYAYSQFLCNLASFKLSTLDVRHPSRISSLLDCYLTRHSRSLIFLLAVLTRCRIFLQLCTASWQCGIIVRWYFMFNAVIHCIINSKESVSSIICILCQQTLSKRWFANVNMMSYCDVTNSAHPATMTKTPYCSVLQFDKEAHTIKQLPWASSEFCTTLITSEMLMLCL